MFEYLFRPIEIAGVAVRNRIVMTAHGGGLPQRRYIRHVEERAKGGAGLIILSGAASGVGHYSATSAKPMPGYAGDFDAVLPNPATAEGRAFFDERVTPNLRSATEAAHRQGAACFGQIHHLGAARDWDNYQPTVAPSPVPSEHDRYVPHELSQHEIAEIVEAFAQSARRVKEAGMDGVELHAAHGYLINQFLSPYTNRREDGYGGSLANRLRFLREIIEAILGLAGAELPIGIRVNGDEFIEGGLDNRDIQEICSAIEDQVAYVSVSAGNDTGLKEGVKLPYAAPWLVPAGHNTELARGIKAAVGVPVIVAGRINDPFLAERILAGGAADMVGMVRALVADPDLPNKARDGRVEDIRPCVGMNECHKFHGTPGHMVCAVNAAASRDEEMELAPATRSKRVLVVGAGPGGLEAARIAALRGHHVTLCEREKVLGGRVAVLARDETRPELGRWLAYAERQVERAGVAVSLGREVTPQLVAEIQPDTVVLAVGADDFVPAVPGIRLESVKTATEVLCGAATGARVIVVGGLNDQVAPMTVADLLARGGRQVEIISELLVVGQNVEFRTLHLLTKRLLEQRVRLSALTALVGVGERQVTVVNRFTREKREIEEVDTVVLACGARARSGLAEALRGRVQELYAIGDCQAPRRIVHATLEGARIGQLI